MRTLTVIGIAFLLITIFSINAWCSDRYTAEEKEVIQLAKEYITAESQVVYYRKGVNELSKYYHPSTIDEQTQKIQFRQDHIEFEVEKVVNIEEYIKIIKVNIIDEDAYIFLEQKITILPADGEAITLNGRSLSYITKSINKRVINFKKENNSWLIIETDPRINTGSSTDTLTPPYQQSLPKSTEYSLAESSSSKILAYNRNSFAEYALDYCDTPNRSYRKFPNDCTNFASQCMHEGGGITMSPAWFYTIGQRVGIGYSASWAKAQELYDFSKSFWSILDISSSPNNVDSLEAGDVIFYDWDGIGDNHIDHSCVVTGKNESDIPMVACHSNVHCGDVSWDLSSQPEFEPTTIYYACKFTLPGTVSGTLHKNSSDGPILSGAKVTCNGKTQTTNSRGYFRFLRMASGNQLISFSKKGYLPYSLPINIPEGKARSTGRRWLVANSSINPTIAQQPMSGPPGTTFTQWGTGFAPNSTATLHFRKPDGSEYPTQTQKMDSIGHFEIRYTAPTNKPQGTYVWWGVDNPTKKKSNEVAYQITKMPPSGISVNPSSGNWTDTPHTINISCSNAERIYCTLRTSTDGSNPPDPPEPTIESHDPVDMGKEYISGTSGNFVFWGANSAVKKLKVRFRGYNLGGYGQTSPIYSYSIDLRPVAPARSIRVTDPSPGEEWDSDKKHSIDWDTTNISSSDHMMIRYSIDDGNNWYTITDNTKNDGNTDWYFGKDSRIKNDTDKARIKIICVEHPETYVISSRFKIDHKK